jgi:hypothetical protein
MHRVSNSKTIDDLVRSNKIVIVKVSVSWDWGPNDQQFHSNMIQLALEYEHRDVVFVYVDLDVFDDPSYFFHENHGLPVTMVLRQGQKRKLEKGRNLQNIRETLEVEFYNKQTNWRCCDIWRDCFVI